VEEIAHRGQEDPVEVEVSLKRLNMQGEEPNGVKIG
jgi:hypothetical protein